jgi:hypothetical protein
LGRARERAGPGGSERERKFRNAQIDQRNVRRRDAHIVCARSSQSSSLPDWLIFSRRG